MVNRTARSAFICILVLFFLAGALFFQKPSATAAPTDDVVLDPASVDTSNLGAILINSSTAYNAAAIPPAAPTQQATKTALFIPISSISVSDTVTLQGALTAQNEEIILSGSFALTAPLTINVPANTIYQVTIKSNAPTTLTALAAARHFSITVGNNSELHLIFENVTLDGNNAGGGIASSTAGTGTATINNPQIRNCFINVNTEGGGILAAGITRVEGGFIQNCSARNGGGIFCPSWGTLTVDGTTLKNNSAKHTAAEDTGLGGGIGVGYWGSLVASNCILENNFTTGDASNTKGMGGGIGAWSETYTSVFDCQIRNNTSGNFGGGVLSHWSSTLIIDGSVAKGTIIENNDVSTSPNFGSGGGVLAAAGAKITLKGNVLIHQNKAKYGGGVRLEFSNTATVSSTVVFTENRATQSGGVFSCGASANPGSSTLTIAAATFSKNTASAGACIYLGRGFTLACTGTQFTQNIARSSGGVIYALSKENIAHPGNVTITNSNLSNNSAIYGGAIYMGSAANAGVTLPLTIVGSTVNNNAATDLTVGQGGGILVGHFGSTTLNNTQVNGNDSIYGGGMAVFNNCTLLIRGTSTINQNTSGKSGGGVYLVKDSNATLSNTAQISYNESAINGGGFYLSENSTLLLENTASMSNNKAVEHGGGIAGAQAKSITVQGQATVSGNEAGEYGGGIYGHIGATPSSDTVIAVQGNAVISGNKAPYGGGISAASLSMNAFVPTVKIDGGSLLNNIAGIDGGGIWTPDLNKITVAAGVPFAGNKAAQAYYMLDSSPDRAIHTTNILISAFSAPPSGSPAFKYAYNNYDIVYRAGHLLVLVTFDAAGGTPLLQYKGTQQGSALGSLPPNPSRSGFTFLGWNTKSDGTGTAFDASTLVNADITVYAIWKEAPAAPLPTLPTPPLPTPSEPSARPEDASASPSPFPNVYLPMDGVFILPGTVITETSVDESTLSVDNDEN